MTASISDAPPGISASEKTKSDFSRLLEPYRRSSWVHSLLQVSVTLALFFSCWAAAYFSLRVSYWLTLLFVIPAVGLIVRIFCIMHDCTHGSYFRSRWANDLLGFPLGVLTCTPYHYWRRFHASHHATSGNLDRRGGGGEIRVMTVREYQQASPRTRFLYRVYRHPLILFVIGPTWHFLVEQRTTIGVPRHWKTERLGVYLTNLAILAVVTGMWWLIGLRDFALVHGPIAVLSATVGVWMFYVQHNYDHAYWRHDGEWSFVHAALDGSSYYRLPRVIEWMTASIGLHHIHHLDSKIPNYQLRSCMDALPDFQHPPELTFLESLHCMKLKLWDEDSGRMVTFAEAERLKDLPPTPSPTTDSPTESAQMSSDRSSAA